MAMQCNLVFADDINWIKKSCFGILGYIRFDGVLSNTAALQHLVQA